MKKKYKDAIFNLLEELYSRRKYLELCLSYKNPVSTQEYYKKELTLCNLRIEALENLIECQQSFFVPERSEDKRKNGIDATSFLQ